MGLFLTNLFFFSISFYFLFIFTSFLSLWVFSSQTYFFYCNIFQKFLIFSLFLLPFLPYGSFNMEFSFLSFLSFLTGLCLTNFFFYSKYLSISFYFSIIFTSFPPLRVFYNYICNTQSLSFPSLPVFSSQTLFFIQNIFQ
jgi:hypothetical protein